LAGRETVIIEQHAVIGTEISSRNSEVIHAGIYYPEGSLKARLCVRGRDLLYEYCARRGVPHRRCGKLIVATTSSQLQQLAAIARAAHRNGVQDLRLIDCHEARAIEPALSCAGALLSPSTGIIDSHNYMTALLADAEEQGAALACHSRVVAATKVAGGIELQTAGDNGAALRTRWLINAAGLDSVALAAQIEGFPPDRIPRAYLAKGSYFSLTGRAPFSHLLYPVPEPGGLGVHMTLDLGGQARFGPDVEWVDTVDYSVDPRRADHFYDVVRTYWPALAHDALIPAYAGIRPKISGPGEPAADFRIDGPTGHGMAGIVNLFGIESPGLTASLAIAGHVLSLIDSA